MTYRLSMAIDDNVCLEIEHQTLQEICDEFDKMGGDSDWLLNSARAVVAASRAGEAARTVVRALGGTVQSSDEAQLPAHKTTTPQERDPFSSNTPEATPARRPVEAASAHPSGVVSTTQTALHSDSGTTPDDPWPGEASVARDALTSRKPATSDPWGTACAAPSGPEGPRVKHDQYGREFTINIPDAPLCLCNESAAKMKARSQKTRQVYQAWVCARGMTDAWRNKCDFREYIS